MRTNILNPHRGQIYLEKPFFRGENHSLAKIAIYLPGMILLSLIFIVPAAYQGIKAILLIVIISEILLNSLITGRFHMSHTIFWLFIFYLIIGSLYGLYGFFRGNPGALSVMKETVFYVLIYMFLITGFRNDFCVKCIHYTIILSSWILTFYLAVSVLHALGIWPDYLYYNLYASTTSTQSISADLMRKGQFKLYVISIPSLMFMQPYLLTYYLLSEETPPKVIWLLISFMTLVMVFSGSRMLLIIALFFPLIIFILLLKYRREGKKRLCQRIILLCLVIIILMAILYYFLKQIGFDAILVIEDLLKGFQHYRVVGRDNVRFTQFYALLHGWMENPLFGVGSGGVQWDCIRSSKPWSYELTYMKRLFDWGIVGIILYGAGLAYVYIRSWGIFKSKHAFGKYALAMSIGQIVFLFGCAANPILLKFDSLAIFFLPIAVINLALLSNKHPLVTTQISQDNRTL